MYVTHVAFCRLTLEFSRAERPAFYLIFSTLLEKLSVEVSCCNELFGGDILSFERGSASTSATSHD